MITGFLIYLAKFAVGLAAGAFALKLAAIGAEMAFERIRSHH